MPVRIPLPSGAWVEVKDNTAPADRFAVQDAPEVIVEDGRTVVRNASGNMWKAFLSRAITGWSYGAPIPSQGGLEVLDAYPDSEDDDDALQDALQERFDRISRRRPNSRPPAPTSATSSA